MAVAFDVVGPSSSGATGGTSPLTWSHTCAGSATALYVGVAVDAGGSDAGISLSVTYAGVTMTAKDRVESGGSTFGFVQWFKLDSPATGPNTVSVTVTGSGWDIAGGGSVSFTGSAATGTATVADSGGASQSSGTITLPASTSGNQVVTFICCGSDTLAFTAGTQRFATNTSGGGAAGAVGGATAAASGSAVTTTWTQASDFWGAVTFEVQAGGGGGAPAMPPRAARRAAYRAPAFPPSRRFRQAVPAQQSPSVAEVTRRQAWPRGLARRGHATTVVWPQVNPPYPFAEVAQRREAHPRALTRRGRQAVPVPPQVNPPYPVAELRQQRQPRGLFPRRGHGFTPVPAQQAAAPNPAIAFQRPEHPRVLFQRRGRVVAPVPAQQSAPANPALAFQAQRHPRLLLSRRGRGTVHVPGQQDPAPRQRGAPRPRIPVPRRGHVAQVPQAPAVAPAWVSPHRAPLRALAFIRRRFGQLMPWPQAVQPAFSVGTLTAGDAPTSTLTGAGAPSGTLTSATQATGGPS